MKPMFFGTIALLFVNAVYAQTANGQPAFDAVSIKPAAPPVPGRGTMSGMRGGPGDRDPELYRCTNCILPMVITKAYGIKHYQLSAPDWMNSVRFEISARVPAGATKQQFELMLQNMLAERFKLAIHRDQKEMQIYEMVVAKGGIKVKESVPEPPKDQPPDDPAALLGGRGAHLDKNGYPMIPRGCKGCMIVEHDKARLTAEDATMIEFADRLSNQLGKLVHDATGLKGKYDFDLTWGETMAPRSGGAGDGNTPLSGSPEPADFNQMMISAIQSELGLRLESKKGQVEIIVVDRAEKAPTEN
jgi:uncharacterized protein (TIGR03435 family)